MTFVNSKDFGTTNFAKVYCKLINVARNKKAPYGCKLIVAMAKHRVFPVR